MNNEEMIDMLTETGGGVPNLGMLTPAQALTVLGFHVSNCDQHRDIVRAVSLTEIDFLNEHLRCKACDSIERFQVPARHAISIAEYLCRTLRQGGKFYKLHFETCAPTEGGQQ